MKRLALVMCVLALVGIAAGIAVGAGGTQATFTYTVPAQTFTSTVDVPTVTNTVTQTVVSTVTQTVIVSEAPPQWVGDFETGDFSQYDGGIQAATGRAVVITDGSANGGPSAPRQGTKFFQCRVVSGDNFSGGERCEALKGNLNIANNVEQWYSWSIALPANFPAGGNKPGSLLGDFHSNSGATFQGQADVQYFEAPNLAGANFTYTGTNPGLLLGVNGGDPNQNGQYYSINCQTCGLHGDPYTSTTLDLGPLPRGQGWVDLVTHVIWSDHGTGLVEVYRKTPTSNTYTLVASLPNCSNLYVGSSAYLKLGMDRAQTSGLPDGYAWYDAAELHTGKPAGVP